MVLQEDAISIRKTDLLYLVVRSPMDGAQMLSPHQQHQEPEDKYLRGCLPIGFIVRVKDTCRAISEGYERHRHWHCYMQVDLTQSDPARYMERHFGEREAASSPSRKNQGNKIAPTQAVGSQEYAMVNHPRVTSRVIGVGIFQGWEIDSVLRTTIESLRKRL
jgi:hypothetical protein